MRPELERVNVGAAQSIEAFHYAKSHFNAPWHFHPQHELTYLTESVGTKFIGDFVGPYAPGELVLLSSYLPHCWKNHPNQSLASSTVIQWNGDIIPQIPETQSIHSMLTRAELGLIFDPETADEVVPQLAHIPELTGAARFSALINVLGKLAESPAEPLSTIRFDRGISSEVSSRIGTIQDFVARHYPRKITLAEVAALVHLSEQAFSRFFSKAMGRPFFTFLNEYRINMAGHMLMSTDWSISQIGFACGYESLPFFHKQFRKYRGISPAKFRKHYGAIPG
ncbi:AraC family transcriptional regulator [Pontibacter sp. G13]|uniref:AraC family transcriptional regulator n=1 Tax=Pontibacter sp. G13 TaxID=3074898 RepID=UPI00288A5707|nr:AraC family transcriptional regulator [Pontibacter sp. G13]WNJ18361.1 AraC family transcriptional regulator [Pontibacter sp. G13]